MKKVINLVYKTIQITDKSVYFNKQRLAAIISDTVTDIRLKKLLLISIREEISQKLYAVFTKTLSSNALEITVLKNNFKDDSFLEIEAINTIFDFWINVIWWDELLILVPIRDENGKWGFCNENKDIVIPYQFDYAKPFSEGLSAIKNDDKWGFVDKNGNVVVQNIYKHADSFFNGVARVVIETFLWAYINKKGDYIIEPYDTKNNDKGNELNDGIVRFYNKSKKKFGFISIDNNIIIKSNFDEVSSFSEGIALLSSNRKPFGLLYRNGDIIKLDNFDIVKSFVNGRALIKTNGKYGFIDKNGNLIIEPIYDNSTSFSEGYAAVCSNNKWGFIDINGKTKISQKYLSATSFSEQRAFVLKKSGWGIIDCEGKEYTSFNYFDHRTLGWDMEDYGYLSTDMFVFKNGIAIVSKLVDSKDLNLMLDGQKEAKFGCIDIFGNEILELKYPPIDGHFENGLAKVGYEFNGGWSYNFYGYIDVLGNTYGFDIDENESNDFDEDYYLELYDSDED